MEAKSYDVIVIGSGPSGLISSLLISKKKKVLLVEKGGHDFVLGKRILVSGNGRANFFNEDLLHEEEYKDSLLSPVHDIVFSEKKNYAMEFLSYLKDELSFPYAKEGKLYYPYFNRSESLQNTLVQQLKRSKNLTVLSACLKEIDEKNHTVVLLKNGKREEYHYKDLVLALGGRSLDREDYDSSLLSSFSSYPFSPCLCPVRVKEKMPSYLVKNRLRGVLTLFSNGKRLYQEEGELLFKEDGISGICVFDSTVYLLNELRKNKKATFTYEFRYMDEKMDCSYSAYPYFLRRYLEEHKDAKRGVFTFTFASLYFFKESQISYGGIRLSEIDMNTMEAKNHPHIYLAGEMLDQNFHCGGYNMGLAFVEGYKAGRRLE